MNRAGHAAHTAGVGGAIHGKAQQAQPRQHLLAHPGRVFANAAGEHQRVQARQRGGQAGDMLGQAVAEHLQRHPRARVAFFGGGLQGAAVVGQAGEAQQAALAVQQVNHLISRLIQRIADELHQAGVDVARAGAHHQAFQRGQAHGGVHAVAIQHGGGRGAIAQVGGDQCAVLQRAAQQLGGFGGDITVAGAMKPIAAQAVFGVQAVWNGVQIGMRRHALVKRGVEYRHMRQTGKASARHAHANQIGRVVQRRQTGAGVDFGFDGVVDAHRAFKALAAVHHAVAHRADAGGQSAGVQHVQHRAHGGFVAAAGQGHAVAVFAQSGAQAGFRATQSFGQAGQRGDTGAWVDGGKFQRGTTAINHKNMVGHQHIRSSETLARQFGHKRAKTRKNSPLRGGRDRLPELYRAGMLRRNKILGRLICRKFCPENFCHPRKKPGKTAKSIDFAQFILQKTLAPHPDFGDNPPPS